MSAKRILSTIRPALEVLEDRTVPTTASLTSGILQVWGTDAAETIRVTQSGTRLTVEGVASFSTAAVRGMIVEARGGNDYVDLRTVAVGATVYGGAGNDFIVGTKAADYLAGGLGNDILWGMEGGDGLHGEGGNDRLFGLAGYDFLFGGDGADFLDDGDRAMQEVADGGAGADWNADVVAVNGTTYQDVRQQGAPTCSFLASLAGLARNGTNFTQWVRYAGPTAGGVPQYEVAFWGGSGWTWTRVDFDGALTGADPAVAAEGESWVVLLQRGWVRYHGSNGAAWPHEAIYRLTGRNPAYQYRVGDADFGRITSALSQNRLVVAATRDAAPTTGLLVRNHSYTVVGTWNGGGGNLWVQVRNPWGVDGGSLTDGDARDGLVWVRWSDFKTNMGYLAVA